MATAIAVFSFLPYCQARRGNIVVDTFTTWLPAALNRLHRCVLGPRLRRHDGRSSPPAWSSARSSTIAAARPPCCCRSSSGRRLPSAPRSGLLLTCVALATAARLAAGAAMSGLGIAAIGFGVMLLLIALRMPVGLSMLVVGCRRLHPSLELAGVLRLHEDQPLLSVRQLHAFRHSAVHPDGRAGRAIGHLHRALFRAAEAFAGRLRGGLAMAVIWACTAFGAICGSSVATTATFGRAALPELQRYKYDGGFATGTIAVGGTLGILIPPSIILVVYAITTEQNIAKLFKAALIPGLMAALFYCAGDCLGRAPPPGSRAASVGRMSAASAARCCSVLAGAADRADGGGRHLRRRLHADRGCRRSAPSPCCWSASRSARSTGAASSTA